MQTKTKSVQRVLSALLCLAMMLSIAMPVFAAEVQRTGYYVGGVEITSENAGDVLGDGKVSYDLSTKTLTLKGVSITDCYSMEENCVAGIYAADDLTIVLEGENSIKAEDWQRMSYGIYAVGALTIQGSGSLTAQGGDSVFWMASEEDANEARSTGIYAQKDITISGTKVTAQGGSAQVRMEDEFEGWTGDTYAYSEGILTEQSLYVKDGALVDAASGNLRAVRCYNRAIRVSGKELRLEDHAVVTAASGDSFSVRGSAENQSYATNRGVSNDGDLYVSEDSVLKAVAGTAVAGYAHSYGIGNTPDEVDDYKVVIDGTVVAQGGETVAEEDTFSLGFFATCEIEIGENGYLEATSDKARGDWYVYSEGIVQYNKDMAIHGGTVKATGAEASYLVYPYAYVCSTGLYTEGELVLDQGGSFTATAGEAKGDYARSKGVENFYGKVAVYDGSFTATAAKAEGGENAGSFGVYISGEGFYVYDEKAVVTVSSGDAEGVEWSHSIPLFVSGGDVGIEAGRVTLTGGKRNDVPNGSAYAIYVSSETDEDGVVYGGRIWINSTAAGLFGMGGTKLTASGNMGALYAYEGIELGETMTFKPKDGTLTVTEGKDSETDEPVDVWTIVDAEDEQIQSITVETSLYKTLRQKVQNLFE